MKPTLILITILLSAGPVMACEMCRDATPTATAAPIQASAGLNFNSSIYFMLASIAVAGGWVGRTVVRAIKPLDGSAASSDDRTTP